MGQLPDARGTSPGQRSQCWQASARQGRERKSHGEHSWFCSAGHAGSGVRHRGRVGPRPGGCGGPLDGLVVVDRWASERGPPRRGPIRSESRHLIRRHGAGPRRQRDRHHRAGEYGLAIAFGDGATATAEGGTGDYALADGTRAIAAAGGAAGSTGNNFDSAIDIGNNGDAGSRCVVRRRLRRRRVNFARTPAAPGAAAVTIHRYRYRQQRHRHLRRRRRRRLRWPGRIRRRRQP